MRLLKHVLFEKSEGRQHPKPLAAAGGGGPGAAAMATNAAMQYLGTILFKDKMNILVR